MKPHRGAGRGFLLLYLAILLLPLCGFAHANLFQDMLDQISGRVRPEVGRVVSIQRQVQYMTFPVQFRMVGVPYGTWECFAMLYMGKALVVNRWALTDPFGFLKCHCEMTRQNRSQDEILKTCGVIRTKAGWRIADDPPAVYWRRVFLPLNAGDAIFPYQVMDHKSPELVITAYSGLTKDQVTKASSFLFGVAPRGEVQKAVLSHAYIVMVGLK